MTDLTLGDLRYKLLLASAFEATPPDDPDYVEMMVSPQCLLQSTSFALASNIVVGAKLGRGVGSLFTRSGYLLQEALEKTDAFAKFVNESIRARENKETMKIFHQRFPVLDPVCMTFCFAHSVVVFDLLCEFSDTM